MISNHTCAIFIVPIAGEAPEVAVLTTTSDDLATSTVLASEKREVRTGDNGALVGRLWLDYCGDKLLRISRKYDFKSYLCNIYRSATNLSLATDDILQTIVEFDWNSSRVMRFLSVSLLELASLLTIMIL